MCRLIFTMIIHFQGQGPYAQQIKQMDDDIQQCLKRVNELSGIKESDTGLAPPALWDIAADKQAMQQEQPLQVARCTKIITAEGQDPRYIINVKQFAKFVVDLADTVAPTDIEEGMRVGYALFSLLPFYILSITAIKKSFASFFSSPICVASDCFIFIIYRENFPHERDYVSLFTRNYYLVDVQVGQHFAIYSTILCAKIGKVGEKISQRRIL